MKATKWCGRSWLAHVRIVKSDWLNVWKSGGARRFELSCAVDFKREGCATHVNANGLWFQIACTCKEGLRGRIKGPREYSSVVSVMGKRRSKNPQHPERVTLYSYKKKVWQAGIPVFSGSQGLSGVICKPEVLLLSGNEIIDFAIHYSSVYLCITNWFEMHCWYVPFRLSWSALTVHNIFKVRHIWVVLSRVQKSEIE